MKKTSSVFKILTVVMIIAAAVTMFSACTEDEISVSYIKGVQGFKEFYYVGETIDYSAVTVDVVMSDGTFVPVLLSETIYTPVTTDTIGDKEILIAYQGKNFPYTVRVVSAASDKKPLSAPTKLAVSNNVLSWSAVSNATGYSVYMNDALYKKVGSQVTTCVFDVPEGGSASFYVIAHAAQDSAFTDSAKSQVLVVQGLIKLPTPANFKLTGTVLSWDAVSAEGIEQSSVTYVIKQDNGVAARVTGTSFDIAALNLGASSKPYEFSVYATSTNSKAVQSDNTATVSYSVTRLAVPEISVSGRTVRWNAVEGATKYILYMNGVKVTETNQTTYEITQTEVGSYAFSVEAVGNGVNVLNSYVSQAQKFTVVKLLVPSEVSIFNNTLTWKEVEGANQYVVSLYNANDNTQVKQSSFSVNSVNLNEFVTQNGNYYIKIKAILNTADNLLYNTVLDSDESSPVSYQYKTPLPAPTGINYSGGNLRWDSVSGAFYEVYNQYGLVYTGTLTRASVGNLQSSANIKLDYGSYQLKVRAIPNSGNDTYVQSAFSSEVTVKITRSLEAPELSLDGTVLSWNAVKDADYYMITVNGQEVVISEGSPVLQDIAAAEFRCEQTYFDLAVQPAGIYSVKVVACSDTPDIFITDAASEAAYDDVKITKVLAAPSGASVSAQGNVTFDAVPFAREYLVEILNSNGIKLGETSSAVNNVNISDISSFVPEQGEFVIRLTSLAYDFEGYFFNSQTSTVAYSVVKLGTAELSVGDRIAYYEGETLKGYNRMLYWNAVSGANGYVIYLNGDEIQEAAAGDTSVKLEKLFPDETATYTIGIQAVGNGTNKLDGDIFTVELEVIGVEDLQAPVNYVYDNALSAITWEAVPGADGYIVYYEKYDNSYTGTYTPVEVSSNILPVNNTQLPGGNKYRIYVCSFINIEGLQRKEVGSADNMIEFDIKTQLNASYDAGTQNINWNASAAGEYIVYAGDIVYRVNATQAGLMTLNVSALNLMGGTYEIRIARAGDNVQQNPVAVIVKLEKPVAGVKDGMLVWDAVPGADGYYVSVNGEQEYFVSNNYLDKYAFTGGFASEDRYFEVLIRATSASVGNGYVFDSETAVTGVNKLSSPVVNTGTMSWTLGGRAYMVVREYTVGSDKFQQEIYISKEIWDSASEADRAKFAYTVSGDVVTLKNVQNITEYTVVAISDGYIYSDGWSYPACPDSDVIKYGLGTEESPYIISTPEQFYAINDYTGKNFKIDADIVLQNHQPFELKEGNVVNFGGYTVTYNFVYIGSGSSTSQVNMGLFTVNNGTVYNGFVVADVSAQGSSNVYVGGVAGANQGIIAYISVSGIIRGDRAAGGIAGRNSGVITACENTASVTAQCDGFDVYAGGIAGIVSGGSITSSSSFVEDLKVYVENMSSYTGDDAANPYYQIKAITKSAIAYAGGIFGSALSTTGIYENYTYSNVYAYSESGNAYVGGYAGWAEVNVNIDNSSSTGTVKAESGSGKAVAAGFAAYTKAGISNSYSLGHVKAVSVTGSVISGGFIAQKQAAAPVNCYYNYQTAGLIENGYDNADMRLDSNEFKRPATFASFDPEVWFVSTDGISFPRLIGEKAYVKEVDGKFVYAEKSEEGAIGFYNGTFDPSTYSASDDNAHSKMIPLIADDGYNFLIRVENTDWAFSMSEDIDRSDVENYEAINNFTGNMFGRNHTVSGIRQISGEYLGLFGINYGYIRDLNVNDITVDVKTYSGNIYAGGVVGYNYGILHNVTATGSLTLSAMQGSTFAGGIAGYNFGSILGNDVSEGVTEYTDYSVWADVIITATSQFSTKGSVGGIVGYNNGGLIRNANAIGAINTGTTNNKGGIAGTNVRPVVDGIAQDNVVGCVFSSDLTGVSESDSPWGEAY